MKKYIIKSNDWWDDLPPVRRSILFVVFGCGSLMVSLVLNLITNSVIPFMSWAIIIFAWRSLNLYYKIKEEKLK